MNDPQTVAFIETVLEELGHHRFTVGQRNQTVADVARRQNPKLRAQAAAAAAIVGYRHDRREVGRVLFEAAQERAQARAASDRDKPVARDRVAVARK